MHQAMRSDPRLRGCEAPQPEAECHSGGACREFACLRAEEHHGIRFE